MANIIANLKWRLFSIVATSLFVIYFIGLGSNSEFHAAFSNPNENKM